MKVFAPIFRRWTLLDIISLVCISVSTHEGFRSSAQADPAGFFRLAAQFRVGPYLVDRATDGATDRRPEVSFA